MNLNNAVIFVGWDLSYVEGGSWYEPNKKAVAVFCVAILMLTAFPLVAPQNVSAREDQFSDVSSDHWYYKSVMWARLNYISLGVGGNRFQADKEITRAEAVAMIVRYLKLTRYGSPDPEPGKIYEDCYGAWFTQYIDAAFSENLLSGYTEAQFHPTEPITRAEAAELAWIIPGLRGISGCIRPDEMPFSDVSSTSAAYDAISRLYSLGIVFGCGNNTYQPTRYISRAEFISILHRAYLLLNWTRKDFISMYAPTRGMTIKNKEGTSLIYNGSSYNAGGDMLVFGTNIITGSTVLIFYIPSSDFYEILPDGSNDVDFVLGGHTIFAEIAGTGISKIEIDAIERTVTLWGDNATYRLGLSKATENISYEEGSFSGKKTFYALT